jgi:arylsulfatase A
MNALVDWCVGEVRRALEVQGVLDDTILIFTSDNGPQRGENGQKSAGPYRGYKNTAYEGGHRVPFTVRWPEKIKAGSRSDVPISLTDMMSTFAEFLDYPLPASAAEDSISILPAILEGENRKVRRPALIADTGGHASEVGNFSIRREKWKLVEINSPPAGEQQTPIFELYDMEKDPYETTNLAADHPGIVEKMKVLLHACRQTGLRLMDAAY